MSDRSQRRATQNWQIPPGVSEGNWDYVRAGQIARGYDQFLQNDPLSLLDRQIIDRYLPPLGDGGDPLQPRGRVPIIADLGCGTGRTLLPLVEIGYRGMGIDLSLPMLEEFRRKYEILKSQPESVAGELSLLQANLVELDAIANESVDHAISLFSTLGMIQGAAHRAGCLQHVARILKPGGRLILHAHNVWFQLRHPGGLAWAGKSGLSALRGRQDFGDRVANYRGVKRMFIHSFRRRELRALIRSAGLVDQDWYGVEAGDHPTAVEPRLVTWKRSVTLAGYVGWIVVCQK